MGKFGSIGISGGGALTVTVTAALAQKKALNKHPVPLQLMQANAFSMILKDSSLQDAVEFTS